MVTKPAQPADDVSVTFVIVWCSLRGHSITFMVTTASVRRPLAHQSAWHIHVSFPWFQHLAHDCVILKMVVKCNAVVIIFFFTVLAILCERKSHITFLTNDHTQFSDVISYLRGTCNCCIEVTQMVLPNKPFLVRCRAPLMRRCE